jgi:hypothetical protein
MKRRLDIQTYTEILAFLKRAPADPAKVSAQRQHLLRNRWLMAGASGIGGAVLALVGFVLVWVF